MEFELPQVIVTILSFVFPLLASILMRKIQNPNARAWVSFGICALIGVLSAGILGKLGFSDPAKLATSAIYSFGCAMTAYKLLWQPLLGANPQPPGPQ